METQKTEFDLLMKKIEKMKQAGEVDLSTEEDLSIAVMNLISLEEHFFFTGEKTQKPEYFNLLDEVRAMRKKLLQKLISQHEGETWCISKHLLAATMRLMEVGTKLHAKKNLNESLEMFQYASKIYSLFWALRLNLINVSGLKKETDGKKPWSLQDILNKLVDCCDEK